MKPLFLIMKFKLIFICIFVFCFSISYELEGNGNKNLGKKRKRSTFQKTNPQTQPKVHVVQKKRKQKSRLEEEDDEEEGHPIDPIAENQPIESKANKIKQNKRNNNNIDKNKKEKPDDFVKRRTQDTNQNEKQDNFYLKNQEELNDPIINSLKENKEFKLCYSSSITSWRYLQTRLYTDDEDLYESFVKLSKQHKKAKGMGNSGLIGVKQKNLKEIEIYEYARNQGSKPTEHSEYDIFNEILNRKLKKNTEIILSSYYCPCLSCVGRIFDYISTYQSKVTIFCFRFVVIEKEDDLNNYIDGYKYYETCPKKTGLSQRSCILLNYFLAFTDNSSMKGVSIHYLGGKNQNSEQYYKYVNKIKKLFP